MKMQYFLVEDISFITKRVIVCLKSVGFMVFARKTIPANCMGSHQGAKTGQVRSV